MASCVIDTLSRNVGSSTLTTITTSVPKAAHPRRPRHTRAERSCSGANTMAMNTAHDTAPASGHSTHTNATVTSISSHSSALLCSAGESSGSRSGMGQSMSFVPQG